MAWKRHGQGARMHAVCAHAQIKEHCHEHMSWVIDGMDEGVGKSQTCMQCVCRWDESTQPWVDGTRETLHEQGRMQGQVQMRVCSH